MIPVTQTKVVIKNSNGEEVIRGNCYAACIASILEIPITEVPNVEVFFHMEGGFWQEVMLTFLSSKGWELCSDNNLKCFHQEFEDMNFSGNDNYAACYDSLKDKYYLVSGKSVRGVRHICIYKNGELVHDPYPTKEGLLTLDHFQTLEKINKTLCA